MGTDTRAILESIRDGMVPAEIYADPEVFELERERVFGRSWCFLAHESEISQPGDYVVRNILDDSFIVVRDESGQIQVLFNMCLHRGMQLCQAERGNASHFRCPYHAWTYKNSGEVVGMPYHLQAYGGDVCLPKAGRSLVSAPRSDSYRGMIFACLDPTAPDLDDFLGDYKFFLDFYMHQSESGSVVRGPQRWRVPSNWKISSENFAGDSYHTASTHASIVDIELFGPSKRKRRRLATSYLAGPGSGTTHRFEDGLADFSAKLCSIGYPLEMADRMRATYAPAQVALVEKAGVMPSATGCLPNLSLIHTFVRIETDGPDVPFTSLRLWQPVSATETEVLSWFVVDREAPDDFVAKSYRAYVMCFGPSGMFEQDDVENWVSITRMAKGQMAKRVKLNSRMGLALDGSVFAPPTENWPAPGRGYQGFSEFGQRQLLLRWAELLDHEATGDASAPLSSIGPPQGRPDPAAPAGLVSRGES